MNLYIIIVLIKQILQCISLQFHARNLFRIFLQEVSEINHSSHALGREGYLPGKQHQHLNIDTYLMFLHYTIFCNWTFWAIKVPPKTARINYSNKNESKTFHADFHLDFSTRPVDSLRVHSSRATLWDLLYRWCILFRMLQENKSEGIIVEIGARNWFCRRWKRRPKPRKA